VHDIGINQNDFDQHVQSGTSDSLILGHLEKGEEILKQVPALPNAVLEILREHHGRLSVEGGALIRRAPQNQMAGSIMLIDQFLQAFHQRQKATMTSREVLDQLVRKHPGWFNAQAVHGLSALLTAPNLAAAKRLFREVA
jgi:hypothetical protein